MSTDPATTTATTTTTDLPMTAGTWVLDSVHSSLHFKVRQLGLTNLHGRFNRFDATLTVGETLGDTRVEATIEMASIDTNRADRDAHVQGDGFLGAEQHPLTTFRSTGLRATGDARYALDGELTMHGVTQPVTLDVKFRGVDTFPLDGSTHAGFSASAVLNRDDFGIFDAPLGMDKLALGKKVRVDLEARFVASED